MRRFSLHRPKEKVRNPERHLRALERWTESFENHYPERTEYGYQNYKIWTLDRLVQGPKAKAEWKQATIQQLLIAARHLINAKPSDELGMSWVAVLLCYPNLWQSEVTVFFDKNYYKSFLPENSGFKSKSICQRFNIKADTDFIEHGYIAIWDDEDDSGNPVAMSEERWTIGEKP